jgi:peptide deformylase
MYILIEPTNIPSIKNCNLTYKELFEMGKNLEKICLKENGIGISAVQVGIPYNFFIIFRNNIFEYYLNAEYYGIGEKTISKEGCLSLKNRFFNVERYKSVLIKGSLVLRDSIRQFEKIENNYYSFVFQHEIDHSNGILISDIGEEIN